MTHVRRPNRRRDPVMVGVIEGETCAVTGKVRYPDARSAVITRDQLVARDPVGGPMTVYRCAGCRDYHVGHESRR